MALPSDFSSDGGLPDGAASAAGISGTVAAARLRAGFFTGIKIA
jgi:hypothetical protein